MAATLAQQIVMFEENERADAPSLGVFGIALNHAGATLIAHGTPDQQAHLPRILAGEEIWCQGFSEPNAGSDLAALQTRAVRDGDAYVVNGQKVWSSFAGDADWCLLLARTDATAPKRKGISYLLLDLRSPGVEIRPLRQITGSAEFCEIFLDDVVVPVANRVGPENEGWKVSQTTLSTERGPFFLASIRGLHRQLDDARRRLLDSGGAERTPARRGCARPPALRPRCRRRRDPGRALRAGPRHASSGPGRPAPRHRSSSSPTPRSSTGCPATSSTSSACPRSSGDRSSPTRRVAGTWMLDHLGSWGLAIGGGTNEIQRNLIAERVLGLPREPNLA